MNLFNVNVPKDSISMIFDPHHNIENYYTTLFLHKSKITLAEEDNEYSHQVELDLEQDTKKSKMVKQMFNTAYGSYILTFLNADFSSPENAYKTFFVYYGLEGLNYIDKIKEKYPVEYKTRYTSTKKFLDYYNKAYDLINTDYIKFQNDMKKTVDFVFDLHENNSFLDLDKYYKFMAYSAVIDLLERFSSQIHVSIRKSLSEKVPSSLTNEQIEKLAYDIANKEEDNPICYIYESSSHFALAFLALSDLIQNSKRNISTCQNCGRYYLQYSGKEVYCELPNADGSPNCKSYASRKAYDNKIVEDVAELTYKREYQRRITQVYRADKDYKLITKVEFLAWKEDAREQLKLYRENKITKEEFCEWIEKNK
ncbi:MAG: hypothetical protein HFJ29_03095 [Clostridia bacterium]|nr:hypothetical protein [Clostridia bacterium]MCI9038850.1 hypothetical protein [Clostridia bacterium]